MDHVVQLGAGGAGSGTATAYALLKMGKVKTAHNLRLEAWKAKSNWWI